MTEHDGRISELDPEVLEVVLVDLNDRLAALEKPRRWPAPDPDVENWVQDWLIPTFQLQSDLEGWQQKPSWVSEITALYCAYIGAMSPQAGPFEPIQWHAEKEAMLIRLDTYRGREASASAGLSFT